MSILAEMQRRLAARPPQSVPSKAWDGPVILVSPAVFSALWRGSIPDRLNEPLSESRLVELMTLQLGAEIMGHLERDGRPPLVRVADRWEGHRAFLVSSCGAMRPLPGYSS